jgi:DNA-binding MarR family transcriptional regulator
MKSANPNPSICSCVNLRRAARAITRVYDRNLVPVSLKITQYSVLANVARSGPLSVSSLARILRLDRTTLVRNLKALETAGFIENHPEVLDPRERVVRITSMGLQTVEQAQPLWKAAQRQIEAQIGTDGLAQLAGLVTALEGLCDEAEPPPHAP